jgi:hypothetical protein
MKIPFFRELENSSNVLIAGAGGGFDVFCGLPLYFWLKKAGKTVQLANLSSGALGFCDAETPVPALWNITSHTATKSNYFPEMHLAAWLSERFGETCVYAIEPMGAKPVTTAYHYLAKRHSIDTIILIDGGTDSLMRGNEDGLGTPEGDMVSLVSAHSVPDLPRKYLVCLGFGIDAHHGVCHAHCLENIAALIADDGYLGAWSLLGEMEEFTLYRDACEYVFARLPKQPSIINSSIIAAVSGSFGNHHVTKRTEGSELFINPLMSLYWSFSLEKVVRRNLLMESIRETDTFADVSLAIEQFRDGLPKLRPWISIPC